MYSFEAKNILRQKTFNLFLKVVKTKFLRNSQTLKANVNGGQTDLFKNRFNWEKLKKAPF